MTSCPLASHHLQSDFATSRWLALGFVEVEVLLVRVFVAVDLVGTGRLVAEVESVCPPVFLE